MMTLEPCPCSIVYIVHAADLACRETVDLIHTTIVRVVHDVMNTVVSWSVWACFLLGWAVKCWAFLNWSIVDKVVINTLAIRVKITIVVKHMEEAQPMPSFVGGGNSKVSIWAVAAWESDDIDLAPIHLEHYRIYRDETVSGRWGWECAISVPTRTVKEVRQDVNV